MDPLKIFYNQRHLTKISQKGYYPEKIEFVTSNLKVLSQKSKLKILDIACNDGYLTQIYGRYGKVLGVDLNKQSIAVCRKRGIECINKNIMDLPKTFHENFDVVIAGDIIEHIFNTDEFLQKIYQLLKPGGTLMLTTANVASLGRRAMLLFGKNPFLEYSTRYPNVEINVGHIRYYTVEDMRLQLSGLGYQNIKIFGDRINLTSKIYVPNFIAKYLPTISRYMFVICQK
jgi:2-polyprenyl-3-methyl-5-hydroxy-6-metoxy-1,4-benzoquinol methylase